jgi:hypothetical protein
MKPDYGAQFCYVLLQKKGVGRLSRQFFSVCYDLIYVIHCSFILHEVIVKKSTAEKASRKST